MLLQKSRCDFEDLNEGSDIKNSEGVTTSRYIYEIQIVLFIDCV